MVIKNFSILFLVFLQFYLTSQLSYGAEGDKNESCKRTWLGWGNYLLSATGDGAQKTVSYIQVTASSVAGEVHNQLAKSSEFSNQVFHVFYDFGVKTLETANQVADLMHESGILGLKFVAATPYSIATAVYRIAMFSPSNDGIKNGIIIPLVGHLRNIREYSKSSDTRGELAVALNRLLLFLPEVGINAYRVGLTQVQSTAIQTVAGTACNVLCIPKLTNSSDLIQARLLSALITDVFSSVTTPGLTLHQRIGLLLDTEGRLAKLLVEIANEMGWQELDQEILEWRRKETQTALSETPDSEKLNE